MKKPNKSSKYSLIIFAVIFATIFTLQADLSAQKKGRTEAQVTYSLNGAPENIILNWKDDPSTTQAVTWRTSEAAKKGYAEIAIADAAPTFIHNAIRTMAVTEKLEVPSGNKYYHSINFDNLRPNTLYAYRVGADEHWSEWFHFRTSGDGTEPFSFIYFGDAQNNVLSLWARVIRTAYSEYPKARFMIHAGDLINHANAEHEWKEWFEAGDWIHASVPSIPTPGNHEYVKNEAGERAFLSKFWRPQFTLPENGIAGLEETVYYIDYENVRIISLNSIVRVDEQVVWLENILKNNPQKWTVITYHYPLYSGGDGRDNKELRDLWKPVFDKYRVDIALQGHDHTYARGRNLLSGVNVKDESGGTMYVVSVSGPKMYKIKKERWYDRGAANTQLFQLITIDNDSLHYKAITATGNVYDAFDLVKQADKPNLLIEKFSPETPERDFDSTD